MSSRLTECFSAAKKSGGKLLIPFITAGDPHPDWTVAVMHALVEAGADVLELGVPFSDPTADGSVIQLASERAIEKQVNLHLVLDMVRTFRLDNHHTPVVLMGYMNPIERFGLSDFPMAAKNAGVDGLLLVDCPPEERGVLGDAMQAAEIDSICLVAPTTTRERVKYVASMASGFIYYVSVKGITGSGKLNSVELQRPIEQIREFSDLPVAVGFGIKNAEMASAVAEFADAVVIGSALVEELSLAESQQAAESIVATFVAPVRQSLDNTAG
jgi:tryptophan synthase alpha chain